MSGYIVGKNWEIGKHKKPQKKEQRKEANMLFMQDMGVYLMTPLLIGVVVGLLLDKYFNTKPRYTLVLIIFGAVASFYNLWRLTKTNGNS